MGDFNVPHIDWKALAVRPPLNSTSVAFTKTSAKSLFNFVRNNALLQSVSVPTRGSNILDLIFTNEPSLIQTLSVTPPFSLTCDHNSITFSLNTLQSKTSNLCEPYFLDYGKGDFTRMNAFIDTVNWERELQECDTVNVCWGKIAQKIHESISLFVPKIKKPSTSSKPLPLPKKLTSLARLKCHFWNLRKNPGGLACFKFYSFRYRSAVKAHKTKCENKTLRGGKSNFYKMIKSKLSSQNDLPCLLDASGALKFEDSEKCNVLNEYFCSVFTVDNGYLPPFPLRPPLQKSKQTLGDIDFSAHIVYKTLKNLPPKKSRTPDKIPSLIFKKLSLSLANPLSILFSRSMAEGTLPSIWLHADVIPLHNKRNPKKKILFFQMRTIIS